ncbi:MAG: PAS domain-containing sensor histidine kinase [Pseudomonadota bacterium]
MTYTLEQARAFIDAMQLPAFLIAREPRNRFRVVRVSRSYEDNVGMRNEHVAGKLLEEVLPAKVAENLVNNYSACIASETGHSYEELLSLGGKERWWSTVLSPIFGEDRIIGIFGIAQEVTAAKSIERTLAQSLEAVSSINADLQALTSTTAHDLRGPMRQAKLVLDMIGDDVEGLGEQQVELLNTGKHVVNKALNLIDERVENIRNRVDIGTVQSSVDIGRWCSEIAAILDPLGRLKFTQPQCEIRCEKFVLDIGLRNLIDNAVKNTRSTVEIKIKQSGDKITLTVSDDGPGFPDDYVLPEDDTNIGGLGLGTAKRLIEARSGKLWIDAATSGGPGARVSFCVPGQIMN